MAKTTIYVLNGPNMNLLGTREPEKYGHATLADVEKLCATPPTGSASTSSAGNRTRKANWSTTIQEAHAKKAVGIIINPAGYTTTSIAIYGCPARCACEIAGDRGAHHQYPCARSFRQNSYVSKAAKAVIAGFGIDGYALAITGLAGLLAPRQKD